MTLKFIRESSLNLALAYHSFLESEFGANSEDKLSVTQRSHLLARILSDKGMSGEIITTENSDGAPIHFYAFNNAVIHWDIGLTSLADAVKHSPKTCSNQLEEQEIERFISFQQTQSASSSKKKEFSSYKKENDTKAFDLLYQLIHSQIQNYLLSNVVELFIIYINELDLMHDCFSLERLKQSIINGEVLGTFSCYESWGNYIEVKLHDKHADEKLHFTYKKLGDGNASLRIEAEGAICKKVDLNMYNFLEKVLVEFENFDFDLNSIASDSHKLFSESLKQDVFSDLLKARIYPPAIKIIESGLFEKLPFSYFHNQSTPEYLVNLAYDCLIEHCKCTSNLFEHIKFFAKIAEIPLSKACPMISAKHLFERQIDLIKIVGDLKCSESYESFLQRYKEWLSNIADSPLYESYSSLAVQKVMDDLIMDAGRLDSNSRHDMNDESIMTL